MSVLYISILGPETKTFLMNEYLLTDQAVDQLSDWPENNEFSGIFRSKGTFKKFLKVSEGEDRGGGVLACGTCACILYIVSGHNYMSYVCET